MLTLDALFAVLQGLPASHFAHLHHAWQLFCSRLQFALYRTDDPLAALKEALRKATSGEIRLISRAVAETEFVMQLSDLSVRQKQALIALRYENSSSLSRLFKILNWDRSNTYRCLAVLMKKGYVGKFYGDKGPCYYSIERRLQTSTKSAAFKVILDYLRELDASGLPQELYSMGGMMTTMTTRTTPTMPTTPTTSTAIPGWRASLARPRCQNAQHFEATQITLAGPDGSALNSPRESELLPVAAET